MSKRFYPSKIGSYFDDGYDDLYDCFEHNKPEKFIVDDVDEIIAEVCGENDEYSW